MGTPTITTADLLIAKYPPIISQTQIAEIWNQHVQTVRRLARAGRLPFQNVSISGSEKRYRLIDVINYLENPPQDVKSRKGRPVGSKNKQNHAPK